MGFSEQGRVCKKHRSHEEKHGVCPSCLKDRLSQLNHHAASSRDKAASSYSSSSFSSSPSCRSDYDLDDNAAETTIKKKKNKRVGRTHHRNASSTDIGSIPFMAESLPAGGGVANGLKKSRSVAASYSFAPQPARAMSYRVGDDTEMKNGKGSDYGGNEKKKKSGFWSKLLHLKGKNNSSSSSNRDVMIQQQQHHATARKGSVY
ncbi:hypothetical protein LINPERPRIM_LOCUS561 [Linum perenne]